jgi:hypothetical protein
MTDDSPTSDSGVTSDDVGSDDSSSRSPRESFSFLDDDVQQVERANVPEKRYVDETRQWILPSKAVAFDNIGH